MKRAAALLLIPFAAALLSSLPVLRAEFVLDDVDTQMQMVSSHGGLALLLERRWGWIFRPVTTLTVLADEQLNELLLGPPRLAAAYRLDARRAMIPHATSLLLHALTAGVVAWLASLVLGYRPGAWAGSLTAGLVFALHPVHSENIAWISGRADTLCALLLCSSLALALLARERRSRWLLSGAAATFLAALLAKEFAVSGLLLLPLCLWMKPDEGEDRWPGWLPAAFFGGALAAYAALRLAAAATITVDNVPSTATAALRLAQAAGFYGWKIFLPWPPTPYVVVLPGALHTGVGLALVAAAVAGSLAALRRGDRLYLFCSAWFIVACGQPLLGAIWHYTANPVAERYLYLPSAGFAIALGGLMARAAVPRLRPRVAAALATGLSLYAGGCWYAADRIWRSNRTLSDAMIRQSLSNVHPLPWIYLASDYERNGRLEEADLAYRRALAPGVIPIPVLQTLAATSLGDLARRRLKLSTDRGDIPGAIAASRDAESGYARATEIEPQNWRHWQNLAETRLQRARLLRESGAPTEQGLVEKAGYNLAFGLRLSPGNPQLLQLKERYRELGGSATF